MNPEAPANLMRNLIGQRIEAIRIDPNNDDLLVKFNKACFAFFSPYRVYPELDSIESLQNSSVVSVTNPTTESLTMHFDCNIELTFNWENSDLVEAFAGTMEVDGVELDIVEQVVHL